MSENRLPHLTAPLRLSEDNAKRLSELATDWDLSMHDAVQASVLVAYMDHLERKLSDARNEWRLLRELGFPDAELPF